MGPTVCPQTCPMGPPGPQGEPGQKGDRGTPGQVRRQNNRDWCNLPYAGEILAKTVVSTSKKIVLLKPDSGKTFYGAGSLCKSICGSLYFPSTLAENNEVFAIASRAKLDTDDVWLRLSDEEKEGVWKDPENRETLTFQNWERGQPNNVKGRQHHANFKAPGKWNDFPATHKFRHVVCEL